jgi:hypothetical protein
MLECLKMEKMKGFHSIGIVLCCVLYSCQTEQLDQKTMQSEPKNAVAIDQRENRVSQKGDTLEQYFIELISNSIQKQGIQGDFEFLTYRYPSETDPYFWMKVGQSTPNRFQTEFNFVCHSKSMEVKYVDVFTGDSIDVRSNHWYKK